MKRGLELGEVVVADGPIWYNCTFMLFRSV